MNQQHETNPGDQQTGTGKRSSKRLWLVVGAFAVAVGAMTFAAASDGMCMHDHFMHGTMDPAAMDKHIDAMVAHILSDGTAEQKARVAAIAKSALKDLQPIHAQMHDAHAKAVALLAQANIDRPALEALRAEQMQQADLASKRIVQAVEDAADVLTPAQRVKLSEHLSKRHGM